MGSQNTPPKHAQRGCAFSDLIASVVLQAELEKLLDLAAHRAEVVRASLLQELADLVVAVNSHLEWNHIWNFRWETRKELTNLQPISLPHIWTQVETKSVSVWTFKNN